MYFLKRELFNGYRCTCCERYWDSEDRYDTLEEAMKEFPKEFPAEDEWSALKEVKIINGTTGDVVACGNVSWPVGYGRPTPYYYSRWQGYTPEGNFDIIVNGENQIIFDKTWDEILNELSNKKRQQDISKYTGELNKIVKSLRNLGLNIEIKVEEETL